MDECFSAVFAWWARIGLESKVMTGRAQPRPLTAAVDSPAVQTAGTQASTSREAILAAADIVAHKWTALLLSELAEGPRRFGDLMAACEGISSRTLAERLRDLEAADVLERHSFPESPPRVEYELTAKGEALLPIVEAMRRFGASWALA